MKTNISKNNKKDSKNNSKKNSKKNSKNNSKKNSKEKIKIKSDDKIKWVNESTKQRNIYENINYKIEPIKIIYKYKNFNRKNQYLTYIFLGSLGKKYEKILNKIENLNLYDTLLEITKEEEYKLIEGFGELWMIKFFNIYHISGFVNKLEEKPELKKKLLIKYEEEWLNNFILKFKKEIVYKKVNYSFGDLVKFQYKIKMGKKLEKILIEKEDIEKIDFSTEMKNNKNLLTKLDISQLGGNNEDGDEDISSRWSNKLVGGRNEDNDDDEVYILPAVAGGSEDLSSKELDRYSRQVMLEEIGYNGQLK